MSTMQPKMIELPHPIISGGLTLAEAINLRSSVRSFSPEAIQLFQLAQVLWAAQGVPEKLRETRTVPSAGATYPLEIYVIIGEDGVETVDPGVYHYEITGHTLSLHISGDIRADVSDAALGQDFIAVAPISLIIGAMYNRTLKRYNVRAERYVLMEAGHASQNVYLQATALGLGTVAVGAFRDDQIHNLLQLDSGIKPLYIMPVGKPISSL